MTTQINQLTELTVTSDDDLILIREDSTGVDKRMRAQNIRAKATTKGDVGLGNVPNLDTTNAVNKAHDQNTDTALAQGTASAVTASEARSHIDATNNPHNVTKAQVGLGSVDNVSAADLRDRSTHTGTQAGTTVTYDNTSSGLVASDVQAAIDELEARPSVEDADQVNYDNTSSGLTATDVQAAIDELEARPSVEDADQINYDNAASGLAATDVQAAIDEVQGGLGTAAAADVGDFATSAQGSLADTAVQPSDIGTIASQDADDVAITGGTINNTPIGGTTASTGAFTTASASTSVATPLVTNAGTLGISATGSNIITASTDGAERMRIDSSGNVGIGTTAPIEKLEVSQSGSAVGIKSKTTTANAAFFEASFNNDAVQTRMQSNPDLGFIGTLTNHPFVVQTNNTERMRIDSSGNVSIVGALSKGSGSFKIDHPLKPETHHLVHSFVEGPQADLIYRGKVSLVNGQATVNIDEAGRMTEGTFEALNCNVQCFTNNESGWAAVRGRVSGNILTIEAQDESCTDEISWMVIGERCDQHMIDTDWTDENGRVITEPEKEQQDAD